MNLIHELENNGSLRKYKRDTHRNMGVSFFRDLIRWTETGGLYEEQILNSGKLSDRLPAQRSGPPGSR